MSYSRCSRRTQIARCSSRCQVSSRSSSRCSSRTQKTRCSSRAFRQAWRESSRHLSKVTRPKSLPCRRWCGTSTYIRRPFPYRPMRQAPHTPQAVLQVSSCFALFVSPMLLDIGNRRGKQTPPPMHHAGCLGWTHGDTNGGGETARTAVSSSLCLHCVSFRGYRMTHPKRGLAFRLSHAGNLSLRITAALPPLIGTLVVYHKCTPHSPKILAKTARR